MRRASSSICGRIWGETLPDEEMQQMLERFSRAKTVGCRTKGSRRWNMAKMAPLIE